MFFSRTLQALENRITMLEGLIHDIEPFLNNKGLIILSSSPFAHAQAFTHAQVIISPHFPRTLADRLVSIFELHAFTQANIRQHK